MHCLKSCLGKATGSLCNIFCNRGFNLVVETFLIILDASFPSEIRAQAKRPTSKLAKKQPKIVFQSFLRLSCIDMS